MIDIPKQEIFSMEDIISVFISKQREMIPGYEKSIW